MLVDNRPPIRRDAPPHAFHDAIPHQQITDSQPLCVALSPHSQIADSQLPFVAPSPPPQSSPQPVFNGPPPVNKTPPQLISITLPDLSNSINSQLLNKSLASPLNPNSPSNRRQKRNANPPRRLEDYYLGAFGENSVDTHSNHNFLYDADITIGYAYPSNNFSIPSLSTNYVYSTNTPTRRTHSSLLRRPNQLSRHHSRRQRPPLPLAIDANYRPRASRRPVSPPPSARSSD